MNKTDKQKIFIGLAWPYVNGDLHIGHLAGYLLPADIFARFNRLLGHDVLMVSGSDAHGTPITVEADQRGLKPATIVKEYHAKHQELFDLLGISFDLYTTTTTTNHKKVVQDVFIKLLEQDYIFKDSTVQFYSTKEKRFLPDRYVEGVCAYCKKSGARSDQCDHCGRLLEQDTLLDPVSKISGEAVSLKKTEHYFLDWPKFVPFLEKYVESKGAGWRKWVLAETKDWLQRGLKARAITRDLDWGIEIPNERIRPVQRIDHAEHKKIYVWFEAVIGYLSASIEWAKKQGKPQAWQDFWQDSGSTDSTDLSGPAKKLRHYYFVGKDNLVFHSLFWPAQLHGYDQKLHLPDVPVVSQFLTLGGRQFSKSRGVTVDSKYVAETYGVDNIRFYLASIAPEKADSIFTWKDFVHQNNSLLIGTIGNFINRTISLSQGLDFKEEQIAQDLESSSLAKKNGGKESSGEAKEEEDDVKRLSDKKESDAKEEPDDKQDAARVQDSLSPIDQVEQTLNAARQALSKTELKKYTSLISRLADFGNKYLATKEPWKIREARPEEYRAALTNALLIVLALQVLLIPLTPAAAKKLNCLLSLEIKSWPAKGVVTLREWLLELKLAKAKPIFSKIDPKVIAKEEAKIKK